MLNRNSKKLPKEDILSIKKTGKRLRNGYALTKLKRWKKEYADRKLRSTTKAEEPKKTYAMNTERLKRAKQTIARRKRSKSMEERREYWRKKKVSGEKKGVKGEKKGVKGEKKTKMVISPKRAMPSKQAISKAKSGGIKKKGEKVGVKGEKRQISPNRAMPTKQAVSKAKSVGMKKSKSVESVGRKTKSTVKSTAKKATPSGRAMPTKQAITKAKSQGIKKKGEKVGVKREKTSSSGRAMPIQNRAMVNKQIVEKIKQIEKPVEIEEIKKPVEIEQIEKPTIKEIAKESKGKVIVASLPKFTEEKIEKVVKKVESKSKNVSYGYNIIEKIVYDGMGLGEEAVNRFFRWIEHDAEEVLFNSEQIKYNKGKLAISDVVYFYKQNTISREDDINIIKYINVLLCWFLYKDVIKAPRNILDIFKFIKTKTGQEILSIIPIFADIKEKKVKTLDNLTWRTFWTLSKNLRGEKNWGVKEFAYFDKKEVVVTDAYKLLILSKDWFDSSIKNKLETEGIYNEYLEIQEISKNGNYPPYKDILPDTTNYTKQLCLVEEEIKKCKLSISLDKYFDFGRKTYITKLINYFNFDSKYKCIFYNPYYMLDILNIFLKLGITKFNLCISKEYSNDFDITDIMFSKKALILEPEDPKHFVYALLMPIAGMDIKILDICTFESEDYYKIKFGNLESLSDDINMSSEVQEIANDVPAFGDLFSDIDYSNEVQEIANDVPAFGDDITEEKIELDTEYDLPDVPIKRDDSKIASSKDIRAMKFKQMMLPSKYKSLLGKVPENFRLLLWGAPGHGKSSLALTIANDIGKRVKTLYVSAEESLESATLSSRIKRFKATSRNLMFNDTNNPEIIEKIIMTFNPKFIVIDSVNVILGKTEAIINLMLKYPNIGFIIIAQATKDRKRYAGLGSLAHAVDIVVNVKDGLATAEKNRYAQLGSMVVKGIKI